MAKYILRRYFSGIEGQRQATEALMRGADGNIAKGYGNLSKSYTSKNNAYNAAKEANQKAYNEFMSKNKGATRQQYYQSEVGKKNWENMQNAKKNLRQSMENVGTKAGTNINTTANTMLRENTIKRNVGFRQGAVNSWNRMGTMGRVGVVAGGALAAGLMAKGVASSFGGNKRDDR